MLEFYRKDNELFFIDLDNFSRNNCPLKIFTRWEAPLPAFEIFDTVSQCSRKSASS